MADGQLLIDFLMCKIVNFSLPLQFQMPLIEVTVFWL